MLTRLRRWLMDWSSQAMLVLAGILLGSAARYFLGAPEIENENDRLRFETPLVLPQQTEKMDTPTQGESSSQPNSNLISKSAAGE